MIGRAVGRGVSLKGNSGPVTSLEAVTSVKIWLLLFFVVQENNNSKKLKCLSPFTQLSRGHFLERPCLQSVGVLPRHHLSLMNVFSFMFTDKYFVRRLHFGWFGETKMASTITTSLPVISNFVRTHVRN